MGNQTSKSHEKNNNSTTKESVESYDYITNKIITIPKYYVSVPTCKLLTQVWSGQWSNALKRKFLLF